MTQLGLVYVSYKIMASYKTDFLHTLRWTGKFYLFFLEIWPKLRAKLIFQVFLTFFWKEEIYLIRGLWKIQVFSKEGLMKRGPQRRLSRPGKCDFRHPKAKSACFDISFFKVKVSFFLHKNITKLRKNNANTLYFIFFSIIFVFRQGQDQQEAFFRGIFPQKAEPQDHSQQVFPSKCTS